MDKKLKISRAVSMTFILTLPLVANATLIPSLTQVNLTHSAYTGSYIGVVAGPAWGKSNYQTSPNCVPSPLGGTFCAEDPAASLVNGDAVASSGSGSLNSNGFIYGLEAGYNFRQNNFVYGGEIDASGFNLSKSTTANGSFPFEFAGTSYQLYDSVSTNWLSTLRARLGMVTHQQFLLYGTGGLALTSIKVSSSYSDNAFVPGFTPGGSGNSSTNTVQPGWALGIGGEWAFNDNYSAKIEYLYVKFGTVNLNVPLSNTPEFSQTMRVGANLSAQMIRIGINYRG